MRFVRQRPWYRSRVELGRHEDNLLTGCGFDPLCGCLWVPLYLFVLALALPLRWIRRRSGEKDAPL